MPSVKPTKFLLAYEKQMQLSLENKEGVVLKITGFFATSVRFQRNADSDVILDIINCMQPTYRLLSGCN